MTATALTLPTIHLNGSNRQRLREDYLQAHRALLKARDAFAAIDCHARDYYVAGPDAWPQARSQRDAALHKFGQLSEYLEAHLLHLSHG